MKNLQLTITAPPGNILGNYGHIDSFQMSSTEGVITATSVKVQVYVSVTAKQNGAVPVGTWNYRLPKGTVLADANDSTGVINNYLLTTKATGTWNSQQQPWTPGWTGATLVD